MTTNNEIFREYLICLQSDIDNLLCHDYEDLEKLNILRGLISGMKSIKKTIKENYKGVDNDL
jgi:hypothetical protein